MARLKLSLLLAVLCLGAPMATAPVHAWGLGISIGVPFPAFYPRPYYYPYPYCYPAYPYYYAPAPVVAPPVVVQPAPATVVVPTAGVAPAPTVAPVPATAVQGPAPTITPAATTVVQAGTRANTARVEQFLQQLNSPQEHVRRDATLDLGRMRAVGAVGQLTRVLAGDSSPVVREAAARALGLIAAPQSLNALIQAAQLDNDRDVRHSAQFAVEIIRTNLRGN